MLITFFYSNGLIHRKFIPTGQTVHGDFYFAVMKRLVARIARIRPQYREQGSWWLLHDNAPAHNCIKVRNFLASKSVQVIDHPPYSPYLAPCDYFLFPKLELQLKGKFLNDVPSIQKDVTSILNKISSHEYKKCFEKFVDRLNACIASEGMYFE